MAGGIRENSGDDLSENHEINVTPFIDVMLVLLIIFMVAAPLATVDVNVDLPASTAKPAERPEEPLYLTVKDDLSLNLGNDAVVPHAVLPKLPQLGALECLANAARVIKLRNATVQKAQDASGVLVVELLEVFNSTFGQLNLPSHTAS